MSFDPITGEAVGEMPPGGLTLNYNILQLTMLPHMDEQFQHPLVILDTDMKVRLYYSVLQIFCMLIHTLVGLQLFILWEYESC